MKILYIECNMGIAGDMLMGALLELSDHPNMFLEKMNHLGIPKVHLERLETTKCGIHGTHIRVLVDGKEEGSQDVHHHTHHHASLKEIYEIIDQMSLSEKVKEHAKQVYQIIAEAESAVHGRSVGEIHFHEVGMMDAIADIVGCCLLIEEINPDQIVVSPIKTGFGQVHCAHGIMPVPAPATALILQGIPNSAGAVEGELCTPTGAALVKHFADTYAYQPEIITERIGYGMGKKDFSSANCVRAVLGTTEENENKNEELTDNIVNLCCNLDDMTAEEIGYAMEVIQEGKALDVYMTPVYMKKSRPGTLFSVICHESDKNKVIQEIFKHTTTIGVREYHCNRYVLKRRIDEVNADYGTVRVKRAEGYGVKRNKIEFEDRKEIAERTGKSLQEINMESCRKD